MENQENESEPRSGDCPVVATTCVALYYRGKHRGEVCGKKIFDHEKKLCERHSKCKIANSGLKPIQCTAHLRSGDQCPAMGYYHNSLVCPRHHYKSINANQGEPREQRQAMSMPMTTKVDEQTKNSDSEDH